MTVLSIVIPAYNEEDGIAEIANRVLAVEPALRKVGVERLELLIVDDGSRDRTAEVASSIRGVSLIRHPKNRGYGAALKTGFSKASGELIGFLDADGTYPPEYFPQLCQAALEGKDLVIGSRMAGADSKMPLMRRVGNFFFANLLTLLSHQKVTDSASGMRVFRREILEHVYPLPDGLNLTPVMSTRAVHEKIRIAEVPIPYSERVGRSKLSVVIATRQPSFSAPTRLATGTRTSSRNTSENSMPPSIVRSGRTSMPWLSIGTISQVMPRCFGTSVSVRTSISQ